jgi:UDP-glucose 4-epimerase
MKNIVLTGGCRFIGSHTCVLLLEQNFNVHIIDNLYNSHKNIIENIKKIVPHREKQLHFHYISLLDYKELYVLFLQLDKIDAVIHFACLKALKESIHFPILYYDSNLVSTLNLLKVMKKVECYTLIFSSSATVYGKMRSPLYEKTVTGIGLTDPYGKTKYFIEEILKDEFKTCSKWKMILLRYFNTVGAHPSGLIGENPNDVPNNLMPYVMKVAGGELPKVFINGNNFDTVDGTPVRDYIHVMDLAEGHLKAFEYIQDKKSILEIFNLGSGIGTSVLEMIDIMKNVSGKDIPYEFVPRRKGDLDIVYCNPERAKKILKWKTKKNVHDMCSDLWNFYIKSCCSENEQNPILNVKSKN